MTLRPARVRDPRRARDEIACRDDAHDHALETQWCHNAHAQSDSARKRRRFAIALVVTGLVMLLASGLAPGVAWLAWLTRSLPAALVIAGVMVWYRAGKVFDRGFESEETSNDESHDADR